MIRDISTVIILIAALASAAHAQQKPNFSGVWALDPAPGTSYSVLWIWSLSDDGMTLTVDGVSTSISPSFDFTVASAPRGFIPDRHIYTRVASPEERSFTLGDALIRFGREPGSLAVTCAVQSCTLTDVVAGRRQQSRTIASGGEAIVSLQAVTLIAATRD